MELHIIYGWHLDGPSFPEQPPLGTVLMGPNGLLHEIAFRLGLVRPFPHKSLRIAEYAAVLSSVDNGKRFYSRSFALDRWATAKAVLSLRDELLAAGWNQQGANWQSERLRTLLEIEVVSNFPRTQLSDLSSRILEMLDAGATVPIRKLTLLDREEDLPPVWRRLLQALAKTGIEIETFKTVAQNSVTDAGKIASYLSTRDPTNLALTGDGTLTIVESDDELQAADFTTSILSGPVSPETVVVRNNIPSHLNLLLHRRGLPSLGGVASPSAGVLQLLPLTLALLWDPVDPRLMLEFLSVPYLPIPAYIASCFANAIRQQPGIGGTAWIEAWREASARKLAILSTEQLDAGEAERSLAKAAESWRQWLEPARFNTSEGIPVSHLMAACSRVRNHANKMYAIHSHAILLELAELADVLAKSAELTGSSRIPQSQLGRMLESVLSESSRARDPEASQWITVDHPGQIAAHASHVIWWGFVNTVAPPRPQKWTRAELAELAEHDVLIDLPSRQIAREARSWHRPFLAGCERVTLIKPRTVAGTPVAAHPFFHEISDLLEASPPSVRDKLMVQVSRIYDSSFYQFGTYSVPRIKVNNQSLPLPRHLWRLKPDSVAINEQSPSSMESLLGCPLNWLLRSRAKIHTGNLLGLTQGERLAGNLAHEIFAALFSQKVEACAISERVESLFDQLCPQIAATLLLPGNSLERSRLKRSIGEAASHLHSIILESGYNSIQCETEHRGQYDSLNLFGRTDMILSRLPSRSDTGQARNNTRQATDIDAHPADGMNDDMLSEALLVQESRNNVSSGESERTFAQSSNNVLALQHDRALTTESRSSLEGSGNGSRRFRASDHCASSALQSDRQPTIENQSVLKDHCGSEQQSAAVQPGSAFEPHEANNHTIQQTSATARHESTFESHEAHNHTIQQTSATARHEPAFESHEAHNYTIQQTSATARHESAFELLEAHNHTIQQTSGAARYESALDLQEAQSRSPDVVLDLKWSRSAAYRRTEIEQGRAIQLAIYAWLHEHNSKRETVAAFYMLAQKQLLCTAGDVFAKYTHIVGPPLGNVFLDIAHSYSRQAKNIAEGVVLATGITNYIDEAGRESSLAVGHGDHIQSQTTDDSMQDASMQTDQSKAENSIEGKELIIEPPCQFCHFGRLCGKKEFAT